MSQNVEAMNTGTANAFSGFSPDASPGASPGTSLNNSANPAGGLASGAQAQGSNSLLDSAAAAVPAAPLAPDSYDLKIPEVSGTIVSPEEMGDFTHFAKGSDLSNAQAQAVLDYGLQRNAAAQEQQAQLKVQWEDFVKADRELGGDRLNTTVMTANQAIAAYDKSGSISQLLRDSGYGSHPDVIRFLYKVGKSLGEDIVPGGGGSGRAELPLEERLYPHYSVRQ